MSAEEERGFVIRDRRGRTDEASTSPSAEAHSTAQKRPEVSPSREDPLPPVTFSSFVFSLGTSALMLMGEQLDPGQEKVPVNLSQAKEIIDILSVLETKTRGNLTADEQAVLQELLYALRMKYVDLSSPPGQGSPTAAQSS
jgi:hypothetical protein